MSLVTTDPLSTRRQVGSGILVGTLTLLGAASVLLGLGAAAQAGLGLYNTWPVPVKIVGVPSMTAMGLVPSVEGFEFPDGSLGWPAASPDEWTGGEPLPVIQTGGLALPLADAGPIVRLAAGAPLWTLLLAGGCAVLLLVPVVRSYAATRPFTPGTAWRLAVAAGVVATGWALAALLPYLAAGAAIDGHLYVGRALPAHWIAPHFQPAWWPLLVVVLLAGLAASSRRGERLTAETEGLV